MPIATHAKKGVIRTAPPAARAAQRYLANSLHRYEVGQHEYYARLALEQAAIALQEGNYGIGAVAVVVTPTVVSEYPARNAMATGVGVVDHAETRALLNVRSGTKPARTYPRNMNAWTMALSEGITVYGTLEPCPMCVCTLTNAGARCSISTVLDGELVEVDGVRTSNGGANVIGEKYKAQPLVWQWIQSKSGLTFSLLETDDQELKELSARLFEESRKYVDALLGAKATS